MTGYLSVLRHQQQPRRTLFYSLRLSCPRRFRGLLTLRDRSRSSRVRGEGKWRLSARLVAEDYSITYFVLGRRFFSVLHAMAFGVVGLYGRSDRLCVLNGDRSLFRSVLFSLFRFSLALLTFAHDAMSAGRRKLGLGVGSRVGPPCTAL